MADETIEQRLARERQERRSNSRRQSTSTSSASSSTARSAGWYRSRVQTHGTYDTSRFLAKFISGIGWFLFGSAIVGILASLNSNSNIGTTVGFSLIPLGLSLVIFGQLTRASIDSADYSRQYLLMMADKFDRDEISK